MQLRSCWLKFRGCPLIPQHFWTSTHHNLNQNNIVWQIMIHVVYHNIYSGYLHQNNTNIGSDIIKLIFSNVSVTELEPGNLRESRGISGNRPRWDGTTLKQRVPWCRSVLRPDDEDISTMDFFDRKWRVNFKSHELFNDHCVVTSLFDLDWDFFFSDWIQLQNDDADANQTTVVIPIRFIGIETNKTSIHNNHDINIL